MENSVASHWGSTWTQPQATGCSFPRSWAHVAATGTAEDWCTRGCAFRSPHHTTWYNRPGLPRTLRSIHLETKSTCRRTKLSLRANVCNDNLQGRDILKSPTLVVQCRGSSVSADWRESWRGFRRESQFDPCVQYLGKDGRYTSSLRFPSRSNLFLRWTGQDWNTISFALRLLLRRLSSIYSSFPKRSIDHLLWKTSRPNVGILVCHLVENLCLPEVSWKMPPFRLPTILTNRGQARASALFGHA